MFALVRIVLMGIGFVRMVEWATKEKPKQLGTSGATRIGVFGPYKTARTRRKGRKPPHGQALYALEKKARRRAA